MPSYRTHNNFNLLLILPLVATGVYLYLNPTHLQLGIFIASFVYATLFMSPDVDVANKIKLLSLRGLFSIPFKSYAFFFKHRGISHSLILGTLTRVVWLFLFVALLLYGLDQWVFVKDHTTSFVKLYKKELLFAFAAIFIADAAHVFLDRLKKRLM